MIEKSNKAFRGECDICGRKVPVFKDLYELREFAGKSGWELVFNTKTKRYNCLCPECNRN